MTKEDYIKIANVLKESRKGKTECCLDTWYEIYDGLVKIIDNERFDIERFFKACTGIPC